MIEHPPPTGATVKALYGTATHCAMTGCEEPLFILSEDEAPGLNSRVAHICARRQGGPRWDPQMSAEENRGEGNLIVMCIQHAALIDEPDGVNRYTADALRRMKAAHRDVAAGSGTLLTDRQVEEVARSSFGGDTNVTGTVSLGGQGGQAPGAGGGGGGAIGPGASGGQGGQGGETVTGWFPVDALPDEIQVRVGRRGRAMVGEDGEDGEDTSFGTLVARGGMGGRAGRTLVAPSEDATASVRVSTAILADAISVRGGLMTIAHGGWDLYRVIALPSEARWPLGLIVDVEANGAVGLLVLGLTVEGPDGRTLLEDALTLHVPEADGLARIPGVCGLRVRLDKAGMHTIRIRRGDMPLGDLPVRVKLEPEADEPPA